MTAPDLKKAVSDQARAALRAFLDGGCTLDLGPTAPPRVSVLVLLHNRAELSLLCFQALALRLNQTPYEVILVDNASADETGALLERVRGVKTVRNRENAGFPRGVNQAARLASGEHLLLLNNDAQVFGRGIDAAAAFLDSHPDVGAVGGKIVLLDGRLQEAGCFYRRDGWSHFYGRGLDPDDPAVAFERDVDYCSGAFLMTPRGLFDRLGGLDEAFGPGYFEDGDYCLRLWAAGWRVVYLPRATALHFENATSGASLDVPALAVRNHARFTARHSDWLRGRPTAACPLLLSRNADPRAFNVLLLGDDLARGRSPDEGLAVLEEWIGRVQARGGFVTLRLTGAAARSLRPLLGRLPRTVEVHCVETDAGGPPPEQLAADYDLVIAGDARSFPSLPAGDPSAKPRCAVVRDGRLAAAV